MNLHGIVKGAIGAVNPHVSVTIKHSTGEYDVLPDGAPVPKYDITDTTGQIQPLSEGDVAKVSNLGVQGVAQKAYLDGNVESLVRATGQGGDLLTIGGREYLVVAVLERWPDWCCVGLSMQVT
jgi:hypothetical protein